VTNLVRKEELYIAEKGERGQTSKELDNTADRKGGEEEGGERGFEEGGVKEEGKAKKEGRREKGRVELAGEKGTGIVHLFDAKGEDDQKKGRGSSL